MLASNVGLQIGLGSPSGVTLVARVACQAYVVVLSLHVGLKVVDSSATIRAVLTLDPGLLVMDLLVMRQTSFI